MDSAHVPFLTQEVTTLIIRNLPSLPESDLQELLTHFGAFQVRIMESPSMRGTAFASFPNQAIAASALERINGLELHGKHLRADYSRPPTQQSSLDTRSSNNEMDQSAQSLTSSSITTSKVKPVTTALSASTPMVATSIAPKLGVHYPAPPHLHYLYPPPNPRTLRNIMTAITAVPKLYTQVLHLMNKMNLPPPFDDTEWNPHTPSHPMVEAMEQGRMTVPTTTTTTTTTSSSLDKNATNIDNQSTALDINTTNVDVADTKRKRQQPDNDLLSSDESELASDDEYTNTTSANTTITATALPRLPDASLPIQTTRRRVKGAHRSGKRHQP
ncbi:hypothetical protein BDF22DRAFT_774202 [Syncephalis plumigaleata]|nr:hypothetical protein BDF22DRAFT_774202 [Syncephalis plumigaleata]